MPDKDNRTANSKEVNKRTRIFREAGSSRVVASASWTILMAIIGAIMLFIYQVIAGNYYGETSGLSYFSVAGSILSLAAALSVGCSQAFIKIAKEKYTIDGIEKANKYIIQMSKINMILGFIISIVMFIIAFININDPAFFIILLGASSAIFIVYIRDLLTDMMASLNRFDLSSIIGGIYGVVVCVFGFVIIILKLPAQSLSFVPAIMMLLMVILAIYFYNKIKTVVTSRKK